MHAIWGSGPNDVYLVGEGTGQYAGPLALHFDGQMWSAVTFPSSLWSRRFTAAAGSGPNDVWLATNNDSNTYPDASLVSYDGKGWSIDELLPTTPAARLMALHVDPSTRVVWAVDNSGNVLRLVR